MASPNLQILIIVRDKPLDLRTIIERLDYGPYGAAPQTAYHDFSELARLGLLEVVMPGDSQEETSVETAVDAELSYLYASRHTDMDRSTRPLFRTSRKALVMFGALGITLDALSHFDRSKSMCIEPFFGPPPYVDRASESVSNIFVLMPFAQELKPVYEDHIKKVVADFKLQVKRADDLFSRDSIMKDIWNAVNRATLCIADCTGRNPNVFYEIGIAHTINKPVILITQNESDVPFDLRHLRYIKYDYTPRGMIAFENQLQTAITNVLDEVYVYPWHRH
jgi:hypothetical protein